MEYTAVAIATPTASERMAKTVKSGDAASRFAANLRSVHMRASHALRDRTEQRVVHRSARIMAHTGAACLDMLLACTHAYRMSRMVQIRNVPDALHRKLKVRAAD